MKFIKYRKLTPISLLAKLIRAIAKLIQLWPLALIVGLAFSPITPHIRWEYRYHQYGNTRLYVECHYLGVRGVGSPTHRDDCPLVILLNNNTRTSL
jgi:hypothetical protein